MGRAGGHSGAWPSTWGCARPAEGLAGVMQPGPFAASREPARAAGARYIPVMDPREHDALQTFAREHHVHFEVEPEEVIEGERREVVGFDVRLFATHGESKLEAPACPRCVELLKELRSFAERVVGPGDTAERAEIAPPAPRVYQSTEVSGADEVELTVRVQCHAPQHRAAGKGEDPCLGELRERLHAIGVPQR